MTTNENLVKSVQPYQQDFSERAILEKEAQEGNLFSQALLAQMLLDENPGMPADYKRAFELASDGAAAGCEHCIAVLGLCYFHGYGVDQNYTKAFELAKKSAEQKSHLGQYLLSKCYGRGVGVEFDEFDSIKNLKLAAAQNYALAQVILAKKYEWGSTGVSQDRNEAIRLYRLAADQGNDHAKYWLKHFM